MLIKKEEGDKTKSHRSGSFHAWWSDHHRGQASKSLFLFFIAGISFTIKRKMGKDV